MTSIKIKTKNKVELENAIKEAESAWESNDSQRFQNREKSAYIGALCSLRTGVLPKAYKMFNNETSYEFNCSPGFLGGADLVLSNGESKLELFSQFYDTYSSNCDCTCREYSDELIRDAYQMLKMMSAMKLLK